MQSHDFQALVERYRDRIFGFALYSLGRREDAEDVTQEVLIRMWKHRHQLEENRLLGWLLKVARNACCDLVRRRGSRGRFESPADELTFETAASNAPGPWDKAEAAAFRRRLKAALDELPEPHKSIVILREIQGLKYDEIAAAVDKPLNTVKVYLHRGRKMLRDELREEACYAKAS